MSGPDVLPDARRCTTALPRVYEVLVRHKGCRSNSVQNDSFEVQACGMDCIFQFAVSGKYGDFEARASTSGLCVNSYLFWNHRMGISRTGLDWTTRCP